MSTSKRAVRYGLLVDIGSASVAFSVVASDSSQTDPQIIWQTRDYVRLSQLNTIEDASKPLLATLTDMSLVVAQEGLKAAREHSGNKKTLIHSLQVTIAAPWSYTVSRPLHISQNEPLLVTEDLLHDLTATAGDEAFEAFSTAYPTVSAEVVETSRSILDTYANGYRLQAINRQETKNLTLNYAASLVTTTLQRALAELTDKLFADVPLHATSSMLALYYVTKNSSPHAYDTCLIDITGEATELGIVRDGSLTYSTHTTFGSHALAREIAHATKRPVSEVAQRLADFLQAPEYEAITSVLIEKYQDKLAALFKETGDGLAIPRTVYVLADKPLCAVLLPTIKKITDRATKTTTSVTSVDSLLGSDNKTNTDTALHVAARFFHTQPKLLHFEYQ